ncbi:MAG: hypothetical protein Q7U38_15655 [Methylobacter sp.]|nr:hypothetical protein [Methylobacter sp.]MDP2098701.1 hypothetical protein [Methylobacter sp.]MDP2427721.1 hypothetical protein [Methylobacter sp.]MDP3054914.1 hypothetical protein [Methylobacter sp.]MDP3364134.1 hypothetical protein [Methylobacter sp.]
MKHIVKPGLAFLVFVLGLLALPAQAATDYSALTNAVTFEDVVVPILAIFAVILGFYIVIKAAKFILGAVKGA